LTTAKIKTYFARLVLFLILFWGTWLALQPGYSLSPWMPYNMIRWLGIPYSGLLWLDHNIATLIHFSVAVIGTMLLYYSHFLNPVVALQGISRAQYNGNTLSPVFCATIFCILALVTELAQVVIGRGFEFIDLLAGWFGVAIAYLVISRS